LIDGLRTWLIEVRSQPGQIQYVGLADIAS
jgi:hypothetical protein